MKGIYVLILSFDDTITIDIGALGKTEFNPGEYCYVGSAMNGLGPRIRRHLCKDKKIHWHIDRLTVCANSIEAFFSLDTDECGLRRTAEECGMVPVVKGFGCSDCRCDTHLLSSDPVSKKRLISKASLQPFSDRSL